MKNFPSHDQEVVRSLVLTKDVTISLRHLMARNFIFTTHVPGMAYSPTFLDVWVNSSQQTTPSKNLLFTKHYNHELILKQYDDVFLTKVQFEFIMPCNAIFPVSVLRLDMIQSNLMDWMVDGTSYSISNDVIALIKSYKTEKNLFHVSAKTADKNTTYTVDHKFDQKWLFDQRSQANLPLLKNQDSKKSLINDLV